MIVLLKQSVEKAKMFWLFLIFSVALNAVKIDRVILATDANPNYIQFWPIVAQAWKEIVGVRPTLILVAPKSVYVDETYGDVIYFEPIDTIPTSYQAQVIRLFAPTLFPDDVCIISDIDMLPLQSTYFVEQVRHISDDMLIIYRDKANNFYESRNMYPMCYVAAKGSLFKDIFSVEPQTIRSTLVEWYALNLGWCTDELMMAKCVNNWTGYPKKVCKLGNSGGQSIDRLNWKYDVSLLKRKQLIDAHLSRPYIQHRKAIDQLVKHLGLKSRIDNLLVDQFSPTLAKISSPTNIDEIIAQVIDEHDVVCSIANHSFKVKVPGDSVYNFANSKELEDFSFIHFLQIEEDAKDYIQSLQFSLESQQIGIINFKTNNSSDAYTIMNFLGSYGYVLFKILPKSLVHIPQWSSVLRLNQTASYLAYIPQYARGWSIFKSKKD